MNIEKYVLLKKQSLNAGNQRIFTQLDYAVQLVKIDGKYTDVFNKAVNYLCSCPVIGSAEVKECEGILSPMQAFAKSFECLCIAHAHIDINWLWGYNETVNITLATIDTMVKLMEMYPDFTFAQSSAIVYQIIAKYRPALLKKVKKYIAEKRFEVSASTFVEADKNIPSGNSLIRQTQYTKDYLSTLLGIHKEDLCLDFEPDTFGHNAFVPEILSHCGVKYYYHCRGNDMPPMYKWKAPNGSMLTVYREPHWYNGQIEYNTFEFVADYCNRYGLNKALVVYGAGDHGGGATMRDIERIKEISSYPIMANVRFGTYREFFDYISTLDLPIVEGEQTCIFTGCYTSQSELKKHNALTEAALFSQEMLCSCDTERTDYDNSHAVECLLASQFHDVVTGSGVADTYNFAMGRYQEAQAQLGAFTAEAIANITGKINTLPLYKSFAVDKNDVALGAGVGYGTAQVNYCNHIAYGNERAFTVFNQLNFQRTVNVKISLWDYYGDVSALRVYDSEGNKLPFAVRNMTPNFYWYHNCNEFEISVDLPALSYKSIILREEPDYSPKTIDYPPMYERTEASTQDFVLENNYVKAILDRETFALVSFVDKATGEEKLSAPATFSFDTEDTTLQMTAWYVGRIKNRESLHRNVKLIPGSVINNDVTSQIGFEVAFGKESTLQAFVCLNRDSRGLDISVNTNFFEKGNPVTGIPSITYNLPLKAFDKCICDVPLGTVERNQVDRDLPCSSFISANGMMLTAGGKHGYRAFNNTLTARLIHASCDPHPYPEYGNHVFDFGVYLCGETATEKLHLSESRRIAAIPASIQPHEGSLPADGKLKDISDNVICVSIRRDETLLFNAEDKAVNATVNGKKVKVEPYSLKSVKN